MDMLSKLAIWKNALLAVFFVVAEVSGFGPIARFRAGECYALLAGTGAPVFWLIVYTLFFIVCPVIDLLAIILKPRLTINSLGFPGR